MSSNKSSQNNTFSEKDLATFEEIIQKYIEENPNDDVNESTVKNVIRKRITDATGYPSFKIMKTVDGIIAELVPESLSKSSKPAVTRVITEDPSASQSETSESKPKSKTVSKPVSKPAAKSASQKPAASASGKKTITTATPKPAKLPPANGVVTNDNRITKNTTITVDGMPYNADAEIAIDAFADELPINEVFESLVKLLLPKESKDFITKTKAYLKTIASLHDKLPVPSEVKNPTTGKMKKTNKVQQFKFAKTGDKKTPVVKYVDQKTLKAEVLESSLAQPIIDYQLLVENVGKKLPKFLANANGKAGFPWLELLESDYVLTYNIFATALLKKLMPSGDEKLVKSLGFFLEDVSLDSALLEHSPEMTDDINYALLFADISRIPTAKIGSVAKNVYTHRRGAVKQLRDEDRKALWFQALNNISSLTDEVIDEHQELAEESYRKNFITEDDKQIIHVWQKLLTSKYVYAIVMNGVAANKMFEKSFLRLISHSTSIRLFMTALYPIAFLFTPFHCYIDGAVDPKFLVDVVTQVTFNKRIKEVISKLITANAINASNGCWCYYTNNRKADKNLVVRMLSPYINNSSSTTVSDDMDSTPPAKDDTLISDNDDDDADGEDNE